MIYETRFPVDISLGSKGGPGFKTDVTKLDSGAEQRVARWESALRQYNVRYGIKSWNQLKAVYEFFLSMKGAAYGFRYKDWIDFSSGPLNTSGDEIFSTTTAFDCVIGVGDGTTKTFQLKKTYTNTLVPVVRNITKPVAGTVKIAVGGTQISTGWSVDNSTGVVTFTTAPGDGVLIQAGFEFDVPVRFGDDVDTAFHISLDDFNSGSIDDITLIEVRDSLPVTDDWNPGGAIEIATDETVTLNFAEARVYTILCSESITVNIPSATGKMPGGPYFYVLNDPDSLENCNITLVAEVTVDGETSTETVGILAPGQGMSLLISIDQDDTTLSWYGI